MESIGANSNTLDRVRIERGFIGAHADINGGYRDDSSLSLVALNSMVAQARAAGVTMNSPPPINETGNLAMHDQSNALRIGDPRTSSVVIHSEALHEGGTLERRETLVTEDRQVRGAVRGNTKRTMGFDNNSMSTADTHQFITYNPITEGSYDGAIAHITGNNIAGAVDMNRYMAWLRCNGYCSTNAACVDLPNQ